MASVKRTIRVSGGVVMTEVMLLGSAGPIALKYAISSKRTPQIWNASGILEANRLFDEEVERCLHPPRDA